MGRNTIELKLRLLQASKYIRVTCLCQGTQGPSPLYYIQVLV